MTDFSAVAVAHNVKRPRRGKAAPDAGRWICLLTAALKAQLWHTNEFECLLWARCSRTVWCAVVTQFSWEWRGAQSKATKKKKVLFRQCLGMTARLCTRETVSYINAGASPEESHVDCLAQGHFGSVFTASRQRSNVHPLRVLSSQQKSAGVRRCSS